jgi:hypothetical protein
MTSSCSAVPRPSSRSSTPGLLDRLGIVVLPVILESGIPLVPVKATAFSREVWEKSSHKPAKETVRTMRLESQKPLEGRAVQMVYAFS